MSEELNQKFTQVLDATTAQTAASKDLADKVTAKLPELDAAREAAVGTLEQHRQQIINDISENVAVEATRAETAADAAQLSAGVYGDTAAGLAAVTEGNYFSIPSPVEEESLILYRHDPSNTATEIKRYPAASLRTIVNRISKEINTMRIGYLTSAGNSKTPLVNFDFDNGRIVVYTDRHPMFYSNNNSERVPVNGDLTIPMGVGSNNRWLVFNSTTLTFRMIELLPTPFQDQMGEDDYLVAGFAPHKSWVVFAYIDCYEVNGRQQDVGIEEPNLYPISGLGSSNIRVTFNTDGTASIRIPRSTFHYYPNGRNDNITPKEEITIDVNSSDRYITYDYRTKTFHKYVVGATIPSGHTILAVLYSGNRKLMYCADRHVEVVNSVDRTQTLTEQVSVAHANYGKNDATFEYSSGDKVVRMPTDVYLYSQTFGAIPIYQIDHLAVNGKYEFPYPDSARYLVMNYSTMKVRSETSIGGLDANDVIIAGFHAGSKTMFAYKSTAFSVDGIVTSLTYTPSNGSGTNPNLDDNRILYNYVQGQLEAADRFNIPALNIWREGGINYANHQLYFPSNDLLHMNVAGYNRWKAPTTNFIRQMCDDGNLSGKSMGIFGGSWSMVSAGNELKQHWENALGITVNTYGVGGAGFTTYAGKQIDDQIDGAGIHDIYLLWCSTNDCGGRAPIGDHTSPKDESTQMGGIGYIVDRLLAKNPNCKILLLTSGPAFTSRINWDTGYIR